MAGWIKEVEDSQGEICFENVRKLYLRFVLWVDLFQGHRTDLSQIFPTA